MALLRRVLKFFLVISYDHACLRSASARLLSIGESGEVMALVIDGGEDDAELWSSGNVVVRCSTVAGAGTGIASKFSTGMGSSMVAKGAGSDGA